VFFYQYITHIFRISLEYFSSVCNNGMLHCHSWRSRSSGQLACCFFTLLWELFNWLILSILTVTHSFYSMFSSKRVLQLFQCRNRRAWTAMYSNLLKSGQRWLCESLLLLWLLCCSLSFKYQGLIHFFWNWLITIYYPGVVTHNTHPHSSFKTIFKSYS